MCPRYIYCSRNCSTTWVTTRCSPALQCFLCGRSNIHYEKKHRNNNKLVSSRLTNIFPMVHFWFCRRYPWGDRQQMWDSVWERPPYQCKISAVSEEVHPKRCIQNGQTDSRHIISPHYHREGSSPWRTRRTHTACSNLRWRREIQWMWRRPDQMRTRRHDSSTCFIHAVTIENFWVSIQMISYSITN